MDMTPARILIVDDDGVVLRTFVRVLCEYAPLHAVDGETARTILGETQIDVVVCDLGLPGLQGLDLMRWAKVHCPKPLWIFVSGEGTFDDAIQALKLGAFDFICKPIISAIQLQKAVANAVRHLSLVAERAQLLRSLADNNLRLAEGHTQLEMANAELQNQRAMLDRDLERADRIVRAILPHALAPIPKLHVSVAYRPSASIGGDFYGATLLDERHLAVYVADAAGHGVSAALLAVLFHQRLSFLNAHGGIRTPAAILADLNHDLLEECRASGLFVTVAYALIDTVARTATIASAGHPPCIWIHAGASEHLDKTGPALGLSADAAYTEHHVSLGDDDRLLLYTDGLTGAISERAPSLETILASVVTKGDDGGRVIDRLLTWTEHGRVEDDLTLLLVSANTGVSRVDADQVATHVTAHVTGPLSLGSDERTTWVVVRGRATWKDAAALRDTSIDALDAGRSVIVDLASCTALDSTMLGTLHELVVQAATRRGSLHVQSADETIRALFTELAMTQVLSSIASRAQPAPVHMDAPPPHSDAGARELVLHAHVLLAELSASNAEQFQPVIAALERDPAL
ncbi:MAG: SpoIIE family protein phosphatase [Deltaproteobacteria bacterium]